VRDAQANGFKSIASAIKRISMSRMTPTIIAWMAQLKNKNVRLITCIVNHCLAARSPKIAVPIRTIVAPSSIATAKS
jgi:hypothetical protein